MLGMGAAGMASGLVGGFAVNGSASRSFAAADAGGRSQVTGLAGAVLVALTLVFLSSLFAMMPLAALGGITIVVAIGLIDLPEMRRIGRFDRADLALALTTAAGVIWVGMLAGILIVILLSLLDVARRAAAPNRVILALVPGTDTYRAVPEDQPEPADARLVIYRFDAPLFFANVQVFVDDILRLARANPDRETVLVNAEAITSIDSTAAQALDELLDELQQLGVRVAFARVKSSLREHLLVAGVLARIGEDRIFLEVDDGVAALSGASTAGTRSP
jgi:sulfate permease, SulP family